MLDGRSFEETFYRNIQGYRWEANACCAISHLRAIHQAQRWGGEDAVPIIVEEDMVASTRVQTSFIDLCMGIMEILDNQSPVDMIWITFDDSYMGPLNVVADSATYFLFTFKHAPQKSNLLGNSTTKCEI